MQKKAQDFLVDTALGAEVYKIEKTEQKEDKISLSIEDNAVPVAMLKEIAEKKRRATSKSLVRQFDDYLRSLGKPTAKEMATFFRLLAIMINAGIPLIRSLDSISEQTTNQKLKNTIFDIAREIEKGGTLSGSMERYPDIFTTAATGIIRAGEASGQLNVILKELALEVEKTASIKQKVRGALMYPAFILAMVFVVVVGMMVFVVPKISEIFIQSSQQLPLITRVVIQTSDALTHNKRLLLVVLLGFVGFIFGFRRTAMGKQAVDWGILRIPIFGSLVQKSLLARFSRSLGNLLSAGVPIIQALHINANALGNTFYRRRVELAAEDISRGIPLGESMRDSPEFPTMMVQMVAIGEQTAQLDSIAVKIAEYYEDEVDTAVASISKIIEPAMLIVVGVIVGGIIGAVMLPIIQLSQSAGGI